jgi:hypothetical protein
MKELEEYKKSIELDLPGVKVTWNENMLYRDYSIRMQCEITGYTHSTKCDEHLAKDADYLRHIYEKARQDILMARGEHYSKHYKSPPKITSIPNTEDWTKTIYTHTGGPVYPSTTGLYTGTIYPSMTPLSTGGMPVFTAEDEKKIKEMFKEKAMEAAKAEVKVDKKQYDKLDNYGLF